MASLRPWGALCSQGLRARRADSDKADKTVCLGGVGVGSGGRNQTETLSFSASPTPSHWPKDLAAIGGEESRVERWFWRVEKRLPRP